MIAININQSKNFITWEKLSSKPKMTIIDKIRYRIVKLKIIGELGLLIKDVKSLLKEIKKSNKSDFNAQSLISISEGNKKILKMLVDQDKIKKGFLDKIFCANLEILYGTLKEIEDIIIRKSFEDNSPMIGFSDSSNDWSKEEENIWEQYL